MWIRTIVLCCLFLMAAAAADVKGKWNVDAKSTSGTQHKLEMLLKEEEGKLGGTLTTSDGDVVPLHETKLEEDELSFKLHVDAGTYTIKLKVSGNSMTGTYAGPSGETGTVAATRL